MRKLAILVVASILATAYAGADAAEKGRHKHANPPKASPAQPVESPTTRVPVPVDTFRA